MSCFDCAYLTDEVKRYCGHPIVQVVMALKGERDALKAEGMDRGCPLYAEKAEYEPKFTVEEWERFWTDHPPEPF